jgi:phosphatidylserine decarboxylase
MVMHVGKVENGEVKQVKGVNYKLLDFLGDEPLQENIGPGYSSDEEECYDWPNRFGLPRNDSVTSLFQQFPHVKPARGNELYHVIVYLGVSDYHHFHSPADWNVQMRRHTVGELLSVAPWVVRQVPNLFCLSERVLLGGYWEHGFFSLTAVGAYNVGSIEIDIDEELVTNSCRDEDERGEAYQGELCDRVFGTEGVAMRKGDHVGLFHLGSTIVLVFEAPKSFEFAVSAGDRVKYGQPLGTAATKMHSVELYSE